MFIRLFSVGIALAIGCSGCAELKTAGRTIGHTTRDVTKDIGHATRDAAQEVGKGTKRVFNEATKESDEKKDGAEEEK